MKKSHVLPLLGAIFSSYAIQANADVLPLTPLYDVTPDIVGGEPAKASEWKFYTQIMSRNSNRSFCGASYIGDGFVLTAAHCVVGDSPSQIAVKIGGYRYNGTDGVRATVSHIYIHPQYNTVNLKNDIALLKLTTVPQGVTSVNIASGSLSQYASVGDPLTVAGLGRTSEGGRPPSVLQAVDVPLVSDATCRQAGGSYQNVGDVAFCAGIPQGGIDSCQGDSGGPIVINNGGAVTQLGIVSWGIGCARPNKYGVYSDIAALRSFIDGIKGTTPPVSDVVSVGYTANETIAGFNVGEAKTHTYTLRNTGDVSFTVDQLQVTGNSVITTPVVYKDTCSQRALAAKQQCQVGIEFNGLRTGQAQAQLRFTTDKTTTAFRATVSATVTEASAPPSGSCDVATWHAASTYNTGDVVAWQSQYWEAQWWTQGVDPTTSGPWGVWQAVDSVDCGSVNPPTKPTPPVVEPEPPVTPPTDSTQYQAGTNYSAGDVVTNNGQTYQCKSWPYNLWCGATPSAYEPGVGYSWQTAWDKI